jgi:hypothetical protein
MRLLALLTFASAISACLSSAGPDQGPSAGQTSAVKKSVGPDGDALQVSGGTVTIPKGALSAPVDIIISTTNGEAAPEGFIVLSSIFHCAPDGTSFAQPVTYKVPFHDDGKPSTMFFSSTAADPEFKDVGGSAAGGVMTASVVRCTSGFVGRKQ